MRADALRWSPMAWSRRRKWFVLILGLAVIAAIWLWPVSPLRKAYNQIREGMSVTQASEVVERCGCSKYLRSTPVLAQPGTVTYLKLDGETLTIRFSYKWENPRVGTGQSRLTW